MINTSSPASEAEAPAQPQISLMDQLRTAFSDFPSEAQLNTWRSQVPGGRIRVFPLPDGKRVFVLRGLTALELQGLQAEAMKLSPEKQTNEIALLISSRATLYTNFLPSRKAGVEELRVQGAGLAQSVHLAVLSTSDYVDPVQVEEMLFDI